MIGNLRHTYGTVYIGSKLEYSHKVSSYEMNVFVRNSIWVYVISSSLLSLNCFSRWCQWANMVIRVDKCATFGIKKFSTRSLQFQPKLLINSEVVPPVKKDESFKYLGRFFNFDMDNKDHKDFLISNLQALLKKIDIFNIHPRNKLLLYDRYVLSKISWHLTVADIGKTWISENFDNIVTKYVRQ